MEQAAFSLKNYQFTKAALNLQGLHPQKKLSIDFMPKGCLSTSERKYKLEFLFSASIDGEDGSISVVEVTCIAEFLFNKDVTLDTIPVFFYPNSIAIIFPYIRAFVSTLTLQANIPPMVLPTLNLTSLQDTLRENTTVE